MAPLMTMASMVFCVIADDYILNQLSRHILGIASMEARLYLSSCRMIQVSKH